MKDCLLYCRISYTHCLSPHSQLSNIKPLQKPQRLPHTLLFYPAWQINLCRRNWCRALSEHERRRANELLVMPRNSKHPSNQCIPLAPDVPWCSLRCRGKRSTVPLAVGTPDWGCGALSKHLLPLGLDPANATMKTEKPLHDTRLCHLQEKKGTFKHRALHQQQTY